MLKTQSQMKLSWWPSPQDYNEAIQIPLVSLSDQELKAGMVYTDAIGLPRPVTGSFASVYRIHCDKTDYALRLFLRNIRDQEARYRLISEFVQSDDLPYTVTFDFLKEGIKIMGEWLPALKMEWVEGQSFDDYIIDHVTEPEVLDALAKKFIVMCNELRRAGIAHGDLQHGNILVYHNELRLVDYDGMYVPKMSGFLANELGHRNYQHPGRSEKHFGPYLDNFSQWIIYTSIRALQSDSRLLHQLGGGDDCLLFKQSDFEDPLHSAAFSALESHPNSELNKLSKFIRAQLKHDPIHVPHLQFPIPEIHDKHIPDIAPSVVPVRQGGRILRGNLPDWLEDQNKEMLQDRRHQEAPSKQTHTTNTWTKHPHPANQAAGFKSAASKGTWAITPPKQNAQWVKPTKNKQINLTATGTNQFSYVPASQVAPIQIPPELVAPATQTNPRKVGFNENCLKTYPGMLQTVMILNPLVWMMFLFAANAVTIDNDLRVHGAYYPAQITNINRYYSKGDHTDLTFRYEVNGSGYTATTDVGDDKGEFKTGGKYRIFASPNHPEVYENYGQSPGARQVSDFSVAVLLLLVNLGLEAAIWIPANRDKRLAKTGIPIIAHLNLVEQTKGSKGEPIYYVNLSFNFHGKTHTMTKNVSHDEWCSLQAGTEEVILCDNWDPSAFVIYKHCRYRAIDTKANP